MVRFIRDAAGCGKVMMEGCEIAVPDRGLRHAA
jgi:hypothetical protein